MPTVFDRMGVRFVYPDNWELDDSDALAGERSVSVISPGGAFWTLSIYPPGCDPQELIETAVSALRQVYTDLDNEAANEELAGHRLLGSDVNFICLDLTNTARVRCASTTEGTYLIFCQADDREFDRVAQVFQAISASLLDSVPPLPTFVKSTDFLWRSIPAPDVDADLSENR